MTKAEEFREHWGDEMDGAALYRALAERSEGEQREIFLELGAAEERHAAHWSAKLVELGEPEPRPEDHRHSPRTRLLCSHVASAPARCFPSSSEQRSPTPPNTTAFPRPSRRWRSTSGSMRAWSRGFRPRPPEPGSSGASAGTGATPPERCARRSSE